MNGTSTLTWFKLPTALIIQPKYQRLSAEAQAGFVTLCCVYWQDGGVMTTEDARLNAEGVDELIDKGYVQEEDGLIAIEFLDEQIAEVSEEREKKRAAGRKSAQARAEQKANKHSAVVEQVLNECSTEKRREEKTHKENREDAREDAQGFFGSDSGDSEKPNDQKSETQRKKVATKKERVVVMPWDSEGFAEAWELWKRYKKEEHRFGYKSAISEQGALKKLSEISHGQESTAIKIIHNAIENGWKGLFATTEKPQHNGKRQPVTEELMRDIANDIANGGWNFAEGA